MGLSISKEIILVGNGPSLRNRKLGRLIDAHELVVRFNSFVLDGFEEDVGIRTSIWVRHFWNKSDRDAPVKLVKKSKDRRAPPFEWLRPGDTLMPEAAEIYVESVCGPPARGKCYSTGLVALAHFAALHEVVNVVGFDGLATRRNNHYYRDSRSNRLHMPRREIAFVDFLCGIAKCRRL